MIRLPGVPDQEIGDVLVELRQKHFREEHSWRPLRGRLAFLRVIARLSPTVQTIRKKLIERRRELYEVSLHGPIRESGNLWGHLMNCL